MKAKTAPHAAKAATRKRARPRRRSATVPAEVLIADPSQVGGTSLEPVQADFPEVADPQQRVYLRALTVSWSYEQAAIAAGVCRKTGWNWRKDLTNEAFQAGLKLAEEIFVERAEREMWRRGIDGVLEPVYQGGRMVGVIRRYDTTAAIFMLKGAKPEKYRERFEHSGQVTVPLFALPPGAIPDMGGGEPPGSDNSQE